MRRRRRRVAGDRYDLAVTSAGHRFVDPETMGLFPGQNPHPVLRMTEDGTLAYANAAAAPILMAWHATAGEPIAPTVAAALRRAALQDPPGTIEVVHERRTYSVLSIHIPELDAYNLYGTDITAEKVVERFPGQNPNPVLRMTPDGHLWYDN